MFGVIIYSSDKNLLNKINFSGFFVGWPNPPSDEILKKILLNSQFIQMAITENKLIGFVNAISDLTLSAYIPLLEVLPEYQGQGIGKRLIENIKMDLKDFYMIDVCCDEEIIPFYKNLGFKQGYSMSLRNYPMQGGIK